MEQLLDAAFRRFKRKGATGIVKLTQAMGGGKIHSMVTLFHFSIVNTWI